MSDALRQLVGQARALAGDDPCQVLGHQWQTEGGRGCHRSEAAGGDCDGSQPVLVCTRCGEIDYGYAGGPADCNTGACGTARPGCSSGNRPLMSCPTWMPNNPRNYRG